MNATPEGLGCPICDGHQRLLTNTGEWEPCPCTDPTDAAHNYREAPNHA